MMGQDLGRLFPGRLDWQRLLRPGDWLVLAAGLGLIGGLWLASSGRDTGSVTIKRDGQVFFQASLRLNRVVDVPGPLGVTRVEIRNGQVRVQSDPGYRQLCVRQGWISPGGAALCLPNRVSVERGGIVYDSLNY